MLPDLAGVALAAPDFGMLGTVGATTGLVAGAGAEMVAGGDAGGVVSPGTGATGATVAAGGVSGFLNGSSQVCRA